MLSNLISSLKRALFNRSKSANGHDSLEREQIPPTPMSPEQLQSNTYGMLERMLNAMVEDRRSERRATIVKRMLLLVVPLIPLLYIALSGYELYSNKRDGISVPIVKIEGVIGNEADGTNATTIVPLLERAFYGPGQRVILMINSPGGSPGDAERIRAAIIDLKNRTKKRVDAVIDGQGASAAYMIALAADSIVAGRYSMVGSIGVIIETWDASELANKNGVRTHIYKSGGAKALGGYMHTPTTAEQTAANELVASMAALFKGDVQKYRGSKLQQNMEFLADGRVWVGQEAIALGLIDRIATPEEYFTQEGIKPAPSTPKALTLRSLTRGITSSFAESLPTALNPVWR